MLAAAVVSGAADIPVAGHAAMALEPDGACAPGARLTIAAVGDLLFNGDLQRYALEDGASYRRFWQKVEPLLRQADIAYGNLEGPLAGITSEGKLIANPSRDWRSAVYRAPPASASVNYHSSLAADLKRSGFALVSTANNHALDRGPRGIEQTIDALDGAGLPYAGTRRRNDPQRGWSTLTRTKGFAIAWVACSYGLNGHPDVWRQVLRCFDDRDDVLREIRRQAADPAVDAVVLLPHWGTELDTKSGAQQQALARDAVAAGAALIIGSHPHVVQEWQTLPRAGGTEALVIYSSGDFVSTGLMGGLRAGIVSLIELRKPPAGKAYVSAAAYVPVRMERTPAPHVVEAGASLELPQLPRANRLTIERAQGWLGRDCR
jgi:poly-gamma-glutamate synthesis protein (capsule biosynthesis protein)